MCWQSELCRSISVGVGWSASGGGKGRAAGIRGWEDDSIGGCDSGLSVDTINEARSWLHDRKLDRHLVPQCETEPCAKPPDVLHKPSCLATIAVPQQHHCLRSKWVSEGGLWWGWLVLWDKLWWPRWRWGCSVNIIASCKASVIEAHAAVSAVNGAGKGIGPTTSSPSVSWPAPGTSTSVRLTCGK